MSKVKGKAARGSLGKVLGKSSITTNIESVVAKREPSTDVVRYHGCENLGGESNKKQLPPKRG